MPTTELLSGAEMALILRITPETVRRWRIAGLIPAVQINRTTIRYDADDVVAALKSRSETIREHTSGVMKESTPAQAGGSV